MTRAELLELIANGENSGVEFKRDDIRPEQLAREVVGLANLNGGRILLGVEDDGSIIGVQRADLETWIMDTVFVRYVHPMIIPHYEEVQMEETLRVAVISISQGVTKPYVVRDRDREDIYIRVGSTTRRATREQQARLYSQGGMRHTELLPVSGSGLADLDLQRLADYLTHIVRDISIPPFEDQSAWHERLCGLGFMTKPDGVDVLCTMAGVLLFGRQPRRLLPQAGVRWMVFDGAEKDYHALEDSRIDSPIVPQRAIVDGRLTTSENGLPDVLFRSMLPFLSREDKPNESIRRERQWHYPPDALREALVNAIAHRDWSR